MTELHDRQKAVLKALVCEYVKSADPVSSKELLETYRFPFSSATIRNDFQVLGDLGYLSQPHVSAGRIPTDKAYRFYINEHESGVPVRGRDAKALSTLGHKEGLTDEEFLRSASVILSELSGGFTTAGLLDDGLFFKYGFSGVLREPEFDDQDLVRDFARCIDEFEKDASDIFETISSRTPEVFIGKENPLKSGREYGMVVYAYEKDGSTGKKKRIVSILGPKRMDYERNISLLKEFDEVVKQLYLE